ncbi:MAG: translation initiation factor IF-2 [Deltaproteobacteria bacterium]|nr:translation initiation factor IF-2 [Deltaproteobacteria bacterium]
MSDKIRVKDLADELKMAPKELFNVIKELSIQAKASNSILADEEIARIKERLHSGPQPEKRDGADVIVRRRRKPAEDASADAEVAPVEAGAEASKSGVMAEDAKPEAGVEDAQAVKTGRSDVAGKESQDAPKAAQAEAALSSDEQAKAASRKGEAKAAEPKKTIPTTARIVSQPARPAPAVPASQADNADKAVQSAQSDPAAARDAAQTADTAAAVTTQDRQATPAPEAALPEKAEMPAKEADLTAKAGQADQDSQADSGNRHDQAAVPARNKRNAAQPNASSSDSPSSADRGKARPESGVRVISRPPVGVPGTTGTGQGATTGAAGSSGAPGSYSRPGQGQGGDKRREWRPGQPGNRPEQGRTDSRGGADREFRPRRDGQPGGQPGGPQGGAGQPGGQREFRPGGPRPAGAGGAGRPGDNAGRRPGGFTTPPPDGAPGSEADRNKRRQKSSKRTVEFGAEAGGRFGKGVDSEGSWMRSGRRGKGKGGKQEIKATSQPLKAAKRKIRMEEFIRVSDLAHQMGLKAGEIIKVLFGLGVMATINQSLDVDTATLVAAEFDYEVEKVGFSEEDFLGGAQTQDDPGKMVTRPPVVTIMGHVDHGKTSLLDAIRKTSVTSGEAGGITQHIGAYLVHSKKGDIVFLDTPGHEAFTAMRARGAEVTDIVVLVVAADDGVMEQTREAINHAKAAGVPIMVAVNKMDKETANPDRVKRELSEVGMVPEEWGGDVTFSYMSAKTRDGLDEFLELLALQADILELKANPDKAAHGHIVEAKLDKGRGAIGTVLIQGGTLRVGDAFVCGIHHGRVRAMFDDQGNKVNQAGPSMPVEVQGFEGVPEAGEEFICLADEKAARRIAETRAMKQRERELAKESKVTLETFLASRGGDAETLVLNLVLKADVQGSLEAITDQLKKLSTEKVRINIVHSGAGAISESDVLLAAASDAIIIGFNVRPNPKTKELAEHEKVDIRFYDIIYKLAEEIKSAMEGLLAPVEKEVSLGTAEVRETFSVPKIGTIAGCHVSDGKITRNAHVRLLRDGVVVFTGRIASLRRFKDDVREVLKGYECGIGIENYNDIKQGDNIEAYEIVEEAATL